MKEGTAKPEGEARAGIKSLKGLTPHFQPNVCNKRRLPINAALH